jgi:hypothetical protein
VWHIEHQKLPHAIITNIFLNSKIFFSLETYFNLNYFEAKKQFLEMASSGKKESALNA